MRRRGVARFVEDLLANRRPRRFRAEESDDAEIRAAITLRAARPGSGLPSEDFVAGLHRRLADELDDPDRGERPGPVGSRRRFVQVGSIAAAAAAIGAGVDHVVTSRGAAPSSGDDDGGAQTLLPNSGLWRTVAASADLAEGGVQGFDLGTVIGFVARGDGQVRAVSGVCTHLGCRLAFDAAARQLNCPCHNSSFAVSGELLHHQLAEPPRALPRLEIREVDGAVQVYAPPAV